MAEKSTSEADREEYRGVFDLPESAGLTPSERILAQLSRRAFLSLWTFPNLHKDQGKEFADGLLIFGDDVVIFSDKHITFNEGKALDVAWPRWYRKAITHSLHQLDGALSWLKRFPDRIFLDAECTRKLPIALPPPERARYHLASVCRGAYQACAKQFPGSLGTLPIRTDIVGQPQPDRPFCVGLGESAKPFVHILDEFALEVILREFDTASDFLTYLKARERFLADPKHLVMAGGEEQLVAAYLLNMRGDDHWFMPAIKDGEREPNLIDFGEKLFDGLRSRPEYRRKKEADRVSYFWDELVEKLILIGDPAIAGVPLHQTNKELEEGLRIIASESRLSRRLLARSLRGAVVNAAEHPGKRWARIGAAAQDPERVYIFVVLPVRAEESYDQYREHRRAVLHAYCRCAQLRFPNAKTFIGIGLDHPIKDYEGGSEDLMVYQPEPLTEKARQELETLRKGLGILPDTLKVSHTRDDEFPSAPAARSLPASGGDPDAAVKERARERKQKRKLVKEARRRNRRKK